MAIDIGDNVTYKITRKASIMEDHEYEGLRYHIDGYLGRLKQSIKLDISTNDAITPKAVEYAYQMVLEERSITLWSYNLETLLAEKLETIFTRGEANTRMKDFYDIAILSNFYADRIDSALLKEALHATCTKRQTMDLIKDYPIILANVASSDAMLQQWIRYQKNNPFAQDIPWTKVTECLRKFIADF